MTRLHKQAGGLCASIPAAVVHQVPDALRVN
jgi:hypothetical protein